MARLRIIVSVSNDMTNDQRVNRICNSLCSMGFDVLVLARLLKNSAEIEPRKYKIKRFKLLINKGFLFYLCLNIRFFFYLLFHKTDYLLSNDLDTLMCNALVSKIRRKKLFYDTHELFVELPELQNSKFKKKVWSLVEKSFIRQAFATYTVCASIANYYGSKYGLKMSVVRNLPIQKHISDYTSRENILIYQGALNMERGIELLIEMMKYLTGYKLYIAGKGYLEESLKKMTSDLNLEDVVIFTGNLNFTDLHNLTSRAKLGFSIEQGKSLNYVYALPNKLFDYIQAGTPVVCSDYPEMKAVVESYSVGEIFKATGAKELSILVSAMLSDLKRMEQYHNNCISAATVLNWEKEEKILKEIYIAQ